MASAQRAAAVMLADSVLADSERERWDAADLVADVWGEPDWDAGVTACLAQIEPELRLVPGDIILEVGCGPGRLLVPLAERHADVSFVGVDISSHMLEPLQQRRLPNVVTACCDGRSMPPLPYADAYSVLVFQHLDDTAVRQYLRAVADRLDAGGAFVFQFVVGDQHEPFDHQRSAWQVLEWCYEAGFRDVEVDEGVVFDEWAWATAKL